MGLCDSFSDFLYALQLIILEVTFVIIAKNAPVVKNDIQRLQEYTLPEIAIETRCISVCNIALKLPRYFYLLMVKPLGRYFQVRSPYY